MKLELDYPVAPFFVNQPFGVNGAWYRANGINIAGHNGIDLRAYHGQPVYAAHDGIAYYTDDDGNEGDGVVLITTQEYEYLATITHFKTIYWHLCDPHEEPLLASPVYRYRQANRGKGMPIKRGDIIGYADNTGFSTGDHLHFGLKPVEQGEKPEVWYTTFADNGYGGAIDPTPYFVKVGLKPWEQLAVAAAKEEAAGRSKAAAQIRAIIGFVRAFTG